MLCQTRVSNDFFSKQQWKQELSPTHHITSSYKRSTFYVVFFKISKEMLVRQQRKEQKPYATNCGQDGTKK